jgi:hypothetical protein
MWMFANAGIPMLYLGAPALVLAFIPVVLIEAVWYWRRLGVPLSPALTGSCSANLWSFCVGLPVAWLLWVVVAIASSHAASGVAYHEIFQRSEWLGLLYFVTVAAWLPPLESRVEVAIFGATLVLLLPAFLVSYLGEASLLQEQWPELSRKAVYRQVWLAHLVTYGLLYLLAGYAFWRVAYG